MAKKPRNPHDPFAEREAKRYVNPIPSREFILQLFNKQAKTLGLRQIARLLELGKGQQALEALRRRLHAMVRDMQLESVERERFRLPDQRGLVEGYVVAARDGYGFLLTEEGQDDLFVSARQMRAVFHNDKVVGRVVSRDRRGRKEVVIIDVTERNTHTVVGRFYVDGQVGYVAPANKRISHEIIIAKRDRHKAKHGQIVAVEISQHPSLHNSAEGRVIQVLGEHMAPGMEVDIAKRAYQLPYKWNRKVRQQAEAFGRTVPTSAKRNRKDLRELPLVTIDGEDAKDFDDAVYCRPMARNKGWRLWVAIADVSAYVEPNTAIDEEALQRGNSVYFPGEVIPMLPEVLSNGLCSLNPNVDRLCMVCEMTITPMGEVERYRFYEAVMRSKARLTYSRVAELLATTESKSRDTKLRSQLQDLYAMYQALLQRRQQRGAIEVETTETQIVFSKRRKIEKIVPVVRNEAHRIIEECMLAANVSAAKFLLQHDMPTLFRIHAAPQVERLADYREFLASLGLKLGGGEEPLPQDYMCLLQSIKGRTDAQLIQTVTLRSLSQAVYSHENIGHFGLAYQAYLHFTSPIRRYPDLLVHRAIKHVLARRGAGSFNYSAEQITGLGEHFSMTERRADEATRDATDTLKCEYMLDKIGDVFAGVISSVTSFGCFVLLDEIYTEGLLHITGLPNDYYQFEQRQHALVGRHNGKVFRLGDAIRVRVAKVDVDDKQIDFALVW